MSLTDAQRRAVETDSRDVLVIAGAGAGKTRVLAHRVAYLLAQGASGSDLMVLTFTRKAAGELKARVATVIDEAGWTNPETEMRGMLIGTFHGVAFQILRADAGLIGYEADTLKVLEPDDADMVLRQVCRDLGYFDGKKWKAPFSWKRVGEYREYQYTNRKPDWFDDCFAYEFGRVHADYRVQCKQLNALDFGMILVECRELLRTCLHVLDGYHQRIKHVLVDELQDADLTQYNLHEFFAPPATFFGVGDSRQSIYGFRGARPDLMSERHPRAEVINLTDCFRCGEQIVTAANALISHNDEPLAEPMTCAIGREGDVGFLTAVLDRLTAAARRFSAQGYAWGDMAILARNHRTLRRLERQFNEADIPCHRVGSGFAVCDGPEFKALHAFMRLIVDPRDNLAFMRFAPFISISPAEYADVVARAARDGKSYSAACNQAFFQQIQTARSCELDQCVNKTVESVWNSSDFTSVFPENCFDFWRDFCPGMTLPEALRWFALRDSQDDLPDGDHVTLLTAHASKGLEWPVVIVANLNEGVFPSTRSMKTAESIAEERRVCYVAVTRAKEAVVLHASMDVPRHGKKPRPPSRFIVECLGTKSRPQPAPA